MKTDETNLPKDPPTVDRSRSVGAVSGATASHIKSSSEQESDTLEAWRRSITRERRRTPRDPIELHGYDLETATPETQQVISTFTDDLKELHEALDMAEHRLERALEERRMHPDTGLIRTDIFMTEIEHLEYLDRQEGVHSTIAVFALPGLSDLRKRRGRAAAERSAIRIGQVLAEAADPSEPACRLGDCDFAILLTALSGDAALARAHVLADRLQQTLDALPDNFAPHDRVMLGLALLDGGQSALETIDQAERNIEPFTALAHVTR